MNSLRRSLSWGLPCDAPPVRLCVQPTEACDGVKYRLPNLEAGDAAVIERVTAVNGVSKRLADMGFVRGARLEMIRAGSPCIVRLEDTRVGLGLKHQTSIQLRLG